MCCRAVPCLPGRNGSDRSPSRRTRRPRRRPRTRCLLRRDRRIRSSLHSHDPRCGESDTRNLAGLDVQVGVASPGSADSYQDLPRPRFWSRDVLDDEIRPYFVQSCCFHDVLPFLFTDTPLAGLVGDGGLRSPGCPAVAGGDSSKRQCCSIRALSSHLPSTSGSRGAAGCPPRGDGVGWQ